jgi:hypothetical protein
MKKVCILLVTLTNMYHDARFRECKVYRCYTTGRTEARERIISINAGHFV